MAAYDEGAHVTYIDPTSSQIGHKESMKDTARVLGRMYDAIEYRGAAQETVDELAEYAGVPVFNGLTDEFHPTQMLADVLTMTEHCPKPLTDIAFAFVGDGRNNVANSLLLVAAKLGMDVRIGAPQDLWPSDDHLAMCRDFASASGARITVTDDPLKAVSGVDFIYTDVWVSMGERMETWGDRIDQLLPFQVNPELMAAAGNPRVKFMHCLPAYHNSETKVGAQIAAQYPHPGQWRRGHRRCLREPGEHRLRAGRESDAHHQGGPRGRARLIAGASMRIVIALGGNALLRRGQPMTAENQRANIRVAAECIAAIAPDNEIVVAHGNGPQVGLLALQAAAYHEVCALSARRARRADRGDDRLRHRAGARQPPATPSRRSPPC